MKTTINSQQSLEDYISKLRADFEEFRYLEVEHKNKGKARSLSQSRALEVYCRDMAEKLNAGGYDYRHWVHYAESKGVETPWTQELFKDVFRQYASALFPEIFINGRATTTKLTRKQMTEAYDLVNLRMSTIFGVGMLWPSCDD